MHQLALYSLRAAADNPKREKDVLQAAVLAAALSCDQDFLRIPLKMTGGSART